MLIHSNAFFAQMKGLHLTVCTWFHSFGKDMQIISYLFEDDQEHKESPSLFLH